jgi:hypothetical protein
MSEAIALLAAKIATSATIKAGVYTVTFSTLKYKIATAVLYAVLIGGSILNSRLAAKRAARRARAGLEQGRTIMVREPTASREIVYGEVRKSGTLVFAHVTGSKNEFIHLIVAVAGHEIEAIDDIFINDEIVALDGSGVATSAPYAGLIRIKKYLGTDAQTADADLISEAPSFWTSAHRLRGIAYIYARLKFSNDAFPGGLPNVSAIIRGKKVYDPRTATTSYSRNWALCLGDYLLDTNLGLGVDPTRINNAAWIAAANIADEDITLNPSGTEKRYTTNGVVSSAALPGDVLPVLVDAGAGFLGYIGGKWIIHAGAYRTPTITLNENDLRGAITIQTKVSRREIFNGIKGVYTSPLNQWQVSDFPPVVNATYTSQDGGTRIWRDIELPFTTSPATAQRVAKISLERARQQITVTLPCKFTAFRVQAGDNVMLTNARMGWVNKVFEVSEFSFVPEQQDGGAVGLGVDLVLRETASGVWDWNDGEETTVDLAPNTNLPDPFTVAAPTGLTLTSGGTTQYIQPDGTTIPRLFAQWTAPADEFVTSGGLVRIEFKRSAETDFTPWNIVRGDQAFDYITEVEIGVSYDVRIRGENNLGVVSAWTTVTGHTILADTTAPAIPTGLAATAGAGFVSLDWNDNTEPDLSEYQVFRSTTNSFGTATKIAEVAASRFVDASGLTTGTTFYYWIKAVDRSENASAESAVASAVPTAPIDTTPPGTPSAPTFNTESTYLSGDGTVFSQVTVNTPALPSGAALNTILYRVAGSGSFLIADQQTAAGTARIDDLSPGVAYEFAVRAMSNGGALSAVSAVLSRSAPARLTAPAAPTGVGFDISQIPLKLFGSAVAFGTRIVFDTAGLPEVSHFEVKCTNTDTDAAVDFFGDFGVAQPVKATSSGVLLYQQGLSIASFVRVRAVSRSGIASAFTRVGKVNEIGNIFLSGGNMASQDANDVTTTGITTGGGGSTPQVLARFPGQASATLTGGTTTEKINIDISSRGFSTKPDTANVRCFSNFGLEAYYDISDAASTSTNAVVFCYNNDGTNLPAGAQNFLFEFIEYT